jgi:hypothetical protein
LKHSQLLTCSSETQQFVHKSIIHRFESTSNIEVSPHGIDIKTQAREML